MRFNICGLENTDAYSFEKSKREGIRGHNYYLGEGPIMAIVSPLLFCHTGDGHFLGIKALLCLTQERVKKGAPMNKYNRSLFYSTEQVGHSKLLHVACFLLWSSKRSRELLHYSMTPSKLFHVTLCWRENGHRAQIDHELPTSEGLVSPSVKALDRSAAYLP